MFVYALYMRFFRRIFLEIQYCWKLGQWPNFSTRWQSCSQAWKRGLRSSHSSLCVCFQFCRHLILSEKGHVDWKLMFFTLQKYYPQKEQYGDTLQFCRHCNILFWNVRNPFLNVKHSGLLINSKTSLWILLLFRCRCSYQTFPLLKPCTVCAILDCSQTNYPYMLFFLCVCVQISSIMKPYSNNYHQTSISLK